LILHFYLDKIIYMSDQEGEGNKGEFLSRKLFGDAFGSIADEALIKARRDLAAGKTDQANEHLRTVGRNLANALVNMTSPKLTDDENEEWLRLQSKRYRITNSGFIAFRPLDEISETRLGILEKKAFGKEDQK